ncbi:hypothetical protein B0H13DRAFT_1874487 [Mycena leptocephala]|nr:hypothetical protein B0H13DRAFT_1874487 [Mycena leptocephala]
MLSAFIAAPAGTSQPAPASDPARPWAGQGRVRGHLAGTVGRGSVPICSALPVCLGIRRGRIAAHTAAGGGVWALGRLWGRAGAGGEVAADDVFVGGVAFGAGHLAGAQRSIHPRQDERSKT